ncbi:MAG: nicotinate-nucleotide adenylyltransferase [Oleiphilaceae bacterium]|nr:nicotinate-nucleotide adenylyltransferase [Oleiphilaceae bacterium]
MKAVFGGSFDPVHIGHLRMATELAETLGLDRVMLMPCYAPVHKDGLGATAAQRVAMLELAVADNPLLEIDRREMERAGPSFTYDSLVAMRAESEEPILLVMGSDTAAGFESWHRAADFHSLCHVIVIERPASVGDFVNDGEDTIRPLEQQGFSRVESLKGLQQAPTGCCLLLRLNLLDVSSTYIRNAVKQKRSIRYLVTDAVARYICDNGLYQANLGGCPR